MRHPIQFRSASSSKQAGFTLIEMLITIAILGVVVASIYSLYLNMQKTTYNQEGVVDSQQNLRVAMDFLSRDIGMAGALIFRDTTGIATGSTSTTLNISTASTLNRYAQVSANKEIGAGTAATAGQELIVETPSMVDYFEAGDSVRIYRPQSGTQPYDAQPLAVTSAVRTTRKITVAGFASPTEPILYRAGDVIVRIGAGAPDPATISWALNGTDLTRSTNGGGAQVVASNITGLQFSYLLDDGTEVTTPAATEFGNITSVRTTLTATAPDQLDGVSRQRSLSNIAQLRNR